MQNTYDVAGDGALAQNAFELEIFLDWLAACSLLEAAFEIAN